MRCGAFDLIGVLAVACFAAVLGADFQGLRSSPREVDVRLSDVEREAGFRAGVSWFALYLDDAKVGFARLARQRDQGGYSMQHGAVLDIEVLGSKQRMEIQLDASLDPGFRLRHFDLALVSDLLDVAVAGVVGDREMDLAVRVGDIDDRVTISFESPPILDVGVYALLMHGQPRVGDVVELDVFDPIGLKARAVTVEYLGREQIAVVDGGVPAHRLRRFVAGSVLDAWVNDLGEVLKEELPLGLVAVRETEAAATWGFRQPGNDSAERLELPSRLLDILKRPSHRSPAVP